ncbi:MAG: CBS domain-containing protein [Thermoleophilia bacterium]|nr:CBS domain-containing protein [Thermoleophilia bacterium]
MTGISPEQTVGIFYKTRVRDVMTQAMVTCDEDARVTDMANQMRDHGIGSVVVVDSENRPRGIVTERDLVYKVVAAGCPGDLTAYDIMSSPRS